MEIYAMVVLLQIRPELLAGKHIQSLIFSRYLILHMPITIPFRSDLVVRQMGVLNYLQNTIEKQSRILKNRVVVLKLNVQIQKYVLM